MNFTELQKRLDQIKKDFKVRHNTWLEQEMKAMMKEMADAVNELDQKEYSATDIAELARQLAVTK